MVFKRTKPHIVLKPEDRERLEAIVKSGKSSRTEYERSKIILMDADGLSANAIAGKLGTTRTKVYLVIDKALSFGIEHALKDLPGRGRSRTIGNEARAYIIRTACTKPKDLGYTYEIWTNRLLTKYIRERSPVEYDLCKISNGTVAKILSAGNIHPNRIKYYMEKTDPDHERKQTEVLHVYREVKIIRENGSDSLNTFLSYDEKPGIQATGNIYPDKPPHKDHGEIYRNHDYIRYGTLSLLAGIDLITGHVIPVVEEKHRSEEFIKWLKLVDSYYPDDYAINIIMDNHSIHSSRETMRYLSSRPFRFNFIFTPTHASWLNIIEMFFSKMARSMLREIRVNSKEELKERILRYMVDMNSEPVIFTWRWRMDEMPGGIES
jgi:transposase